MTTLPDNTTCDLSEDVYGREIVIRPDTIVYLACSIANIFRLNLSRIRNLINDDFSDIIDWTESETIISHIPRIINILDEIAISALNDQKPFLMQPIWKTEGKSPKLSEFCLDVFV